MARVLLSLAAVFFLAWPAGAAGLNAEDLAELPHFVDEIMVRWGVPGTAVAVVGKERVDFLGGFGQRRLGAPDRVTGDTLFAVGSITKGFTAASLACLVQDGVLDLDQPLRTVLPGFTLADAYATLRATPRDLLAHRTGLPRHDGVWYRSPASRAELVSRLRHLEFSCDLRQCFGYNNLMYMLAGRLVEQLTGTSYESFASTRILEPLGMERSLFGTPPATESNLAHPHGRNRQGETVEVPPYQGWAVGPALELHSTAADMARWLQFQLGASQGRRVLSTELLNECHEPQMVVKRPPTPAFPMTSYALGWFVQSYRGQLFLWHTGNIDGYYALVGFLPFADLGVAVLTNRSENHVPEVVSRWIIDRALGLQEIDWHSYMVKQDEELEARREEQRERIAERLGADTSPAPPAAELVGEYLHPAYGNLEVSFDGGDLVGRFHGVAGPIQHLGGEVYILEVASEVFEDRFLLSVRRDSEGRVAGLASPLADGVAPILFLRTAPEPAPAPEEQP